VRTNIGPDLVADVKRVASRLRTTILSCSEYCQHGQFSEYQIYDGGHTWEEVCKAAGLKTRKKEVVSDEEYFGRLKQAFLSLSRYPKSSERKAFGLNFSKRRYSTLPGFIRRAVNLGYVPDLFKDKEVERGASSVPELASKPEGASEMARRAVPPIPTSTKRKRWERIGIEGFPYAPHDELGVVGLFAVLCSQGRIHWQILEMRGGKGIDITCYDEDAHKMKRVELKYALSKGSWNHRIEDVDYVVCWENRWPDFPKPVLILSEITNSPR
jgi:hypothetical protein